MDRARRKEDVDRAYELQSKAAIIGAARFTAVGLGLAVIGHYSWPLFRYAYHRSVSLPHTEFRFLSSRRQTLAFKGFLVSTSPSVFLYRVPYT